MMDYITARNEFVKATEKERLKLIAVLTENGYDASAHGGSGIKTYTSGKRMLPYDLSIWKYIEAEKDGYKYFISLQPMEMDPSSGNIHCLPGRIGVVRYQGKYRPEAIRKKMRILNADLPLDSQAYALILEEMQKLEA